MGAGKAPHANSDNSILLSNSIKDMDGRFDTLRVLQTAQRNASGRVRSCGWEPRLPQRGPALPLRPASACAWGLQ